MLHLDADIYGGVESRTNWSMLPATHCIERILHTREGGQVIAAHNEHEKFSIAQQGGTFLAATAETAEIISEKGKDTTGLGRWSWFKLSGTTTTTRIVVAYAACKSRKQAHSATIAQQRRYWRLQGNRQCPRKLFREQLLNMLQEWRSEGEKIILLIDSNEDMENGTLARCLSSIDLQMYDVIKARSGIQGPNTFIRGSRQIDGAWATPDINVKAACFLPFFFGIGDHRGIVLDIPRDQLIGGNSKSIAKPVARRLRCDESRIWSAYNQRLVLYIRQHRIQAKIDHITNNVILSKEAQRRALHAIDQVVTEGMISAEKKCRKFHKGNVPFSPQLSKVGLVIRLWSLVI